MKPQRVQLSRAKGWRMSPNAIKVDRTTRWGNPFVVGVHGTRAECVRYYELMIGGFLTVSMENVEAQQAYIEWGIDHIEELRGKNLACWCPLPKAGESDICHAAVLLRAANRRRRKRAA